MPETGVAPPQSLDAPVDRRVPTIRHRLEYAAFRVATAWLTLLPEPLALTLASGLGWVAGSVLRIRRGVVRRNLQIAFPERSARWRAKVAGACYRHLARESASLFRTALGSPAHAKDRVLERSLLADDGTEEVMAWLLRQARDRRGVVLVSGHLGNWELCGSALAVRGLPIDAVAVAQANPLFNRILVESRRHLGMRVIPKGRAVSQVLASLAAGRMPALVADQNARAAGEFVEFFGHPASTHRSPALLALRSCAPIVVGFALREHRTRYRVHLERLEWAATGDVAADVRSVTQEIATRLERGVRSAPSQYMWLHKRWRTRPPRDG